MMSCGSRIVKVVVKEGFSQTNKICNNGILPNPIELQFFFHLYHVMLFNIKLAISG